MAIFLEVITIEHESEHNFSEKNNFSAPNNYTEKGDLY
jgi:hypothetical protein